MVTVIDEVGKLELRGGGWSASLEALLDKPGYPLLISVREEFFSDVQRQWKLDDAVIFRIGETDVNQAGAQIFHHSPKEDGNGQTG